MERIDAITLRKWMESGKEMTLVDARAREDHAAGHLPGALSLLNRDVEKRAESLLSRNSVIVVYSNDADCPASGLVAEKLERMGFGPVYDYNDSYRDWALRGFPLTTPTGD